MPRPILEFDLDAFREYVRVYRKARGLSQVAAADEIGLHWAQLFRIEKKEGPWPRADSVVAIAAWMNCDPRDFMKPREAKNVGR